MAYSKFVEAKIEVLRANGEWFKKHINEKNELIEKFQKEEEEAKPKQVEKEIKSLEKEIEKEEQKPNTHRR